MMLAEPQLIFLYNNTATTNTYTLSLHDALPISGQVEGHQGSLRPGALGLLGAGLVPEVADRKSTRLNSSHSQISYAVFCLKKKTSMATTLIHINQALQRYRNTSSKWK